jgi:hypothetical protein
MITSGSVTVEAIAADFEYAHAASKPPTKSISVRDFMGTQ